MSGTHASTTNHYESELYEIRIKGHLDARWTDWFGGLAFTHKSDGTTILHGPLTDQAALHGVLKGLRDLGLPVISVQIVSPDKNGSKKMKAIVQRKYGSPDALEFQEVDKPVVKGDEVLVRVHAASVNRADWVVLTGKPYLVRLAGFGVLKPKHKIPGMDVAGQVEAVGRNVSQFHLGDKVFGNLLDCGLGAFAEYVCVPEDRIALKPANLTFEQAAAVPVAATTALRGLRDIRKIQAGERVLINGASGGVGTFAVQIAKSLGAEVTGVCSTRNVDMARSIGADHVVDYTQEDFTQCEQRYDLVLDLVGNRSLSDYRRALTSKGTLVMSSGNTDRRFGPIGRAIGALVLSPFVSQKMVLLGWTWNKNDLVAVKELIEAGKVTPVVDRRYKLDVVPEALRYHGEGHAQGKTVIAVEHGDETEQ